MLAFFLVLAIFSFWSILGYGLVSALHTRRNLLQNALLSPVAGVAATVLLVIWINCLGVPVRYGGPAATLILAVLSVVILWRYRPILPLRHLLPFVAVLVAGALATGYPFLRYGFNWVSYCNDDMANYCLGAKFFLNHGHFAVPAVGDLVGERDESLLFWLFYVPSATRHGVEELLAWAVSCTGLSPHQTFMPLILSFHLVLLSASGALVLQNRRRRKVALLVSLGTGLSALTTLGATYQLFAQVCGLGMLAGLCTVLLRPAGRMKVREVLFAAMLGAGFAMIYPEILPFFGISYLLYHARLLARRGESIADLVRSIWPVALLSVLLLNILLVVTAATLTRAGGAAAYTPTTSILFPYYLTPAGFAHLWGFLAIGELPDGFGVDVAIILGAVLFVLTIVAGVWQTLRGEPVAFVCLVMVALIFQLFRLRGDFGLFKIAMYIQPFLIGTLVISWDRLFRSAGRSLASRALWILPLAALAVAGMRAQIYYTIRSLGNSGSGLVEIPYASREGLIPQLRHLTNLRPAAFLSDTSNVVMGKFESLYYGPIYFYTKPFLEQMTGDSPVPWNPFYWMNRTLVSDLARLRAARYVPGPFDMHGAIPSFNDLTIVRAVATKNDFPVIIGSHNMSVLNRRRRLAPDENRLVTLVPQAELRNYLAFVDSTFGSNYYVGGLHRTSGRVSMYQLEPDYFIHGDTMSGLGRVSMFRIVNPSPRVRMVVEYTASLKADKDNRIPAASAIGDKRVMFACQGRGSARLISLPIRPQQIAGGEYIGVDMGTWGSFFPQHRSKIMSLYGKDILTDVRRIVGFARDISVISEEEYSALQPPRSLRTFPSDLKNKDLEYSGIYEDGWVAESSEVVLEQPATPSSLVVSVRVPLLHGQPAASFARVLLDGQEVGAKPTTGGTVGFRFAPRGSGRRRIELVFDRAVGLPEPDGRPVSAQVQYVGFEADSSSPENKSATAR